MKRIPVTSSSIREVGYDEPSMTLEVVFTSGGTYRYFDVEKETFEGLLHAPSVGRYFTQSIRPAYRFARV